MSHRGILLVAILFSVLGISISYASLSQNLTIGGSAGVNLAGWNVEFNSLETVELTGSAVEITAPTLSFDSTTISGFDVNYYLPGDSATYRFTISNVGTIDAKIGVISMPSPVCLGSGADKLTDESTVCDNFSYTLTYVGGTKDGQALQVNDELDAGTSSVVELVLTFGGTEMVTEDVSLSGLTTVINYIQK